MLTWPDNIRLMLRESKEREFTASYAEDNVFAGPPYIDDLTDDEPVIYSGRLILTRAEAQQFWLFWENIRRGKDRFLMPIYNEFGLITQECQARPNSFRISREIKNDIFEYNLEIIVPEYIPVENFDYYKDWIAIGWLYPRDFNIFDTIVNENWPEA